jgi:L-ascorbate metabolism protein UlaG (beta-lactamase superfamily)
MRLKLGRPDIARYVDLFTVGDAKADAPLSVTWLGVSTLLIDDGSSALLTDGYFSRPSLARVACRKVSPSPARIDGCLSRARVQRLAAIIAVHTHIDHALDSAVVAERTGAPLVGGESAANVGRGHGLSEESLVVAVPGQPLTFGPYDVTLVESRHCPPDRFPGAITTPITPPVRASSYKCGEAWSTLVHHRPSGQRLLIQGSAGFLPGALAGQRAEVVYLGVGQLGLQPRQYVLDYWSETVRTVGAGTVVPIHWDDFFRQLSKPLRALPYAGDDLDVSLRTLCELAEADSVSLRMPTVWRREDPWRSATLTGDLGKHHPGGH